MQAHANQVDDGESAVRTATSTLHQRVYALMIGLVGGLCCPCGASPGRALPIICCLS
jgi:hypothetical protein